MNRPGLRTVIGLFALCFSVGALSQAQPAQPTAQQRVAMLKEWMAASNKKLHSYEWIETTTISVKGEQKSSKGEHVYYDPEGNLVKNPIPGDSTQAKSSGPPGILLPGKLMKHHEEEEKKEMEQYMQNAQALMKSYVPPQSGLLQQAVDSGNFSMNMIDPGKKVELVFKNYLKSGDQVSIDIDLQTNQLLGVKVASYLDDPGDAVTLDVQMSVLADGTIYPEKSTLDAPSKQVEVTIVNSDYQLVSS